MKKIIFVVVFWICTFVLSAQKYDIPVLKRNVLLSKNDSVRSWNCAMISYALRDQKDTSRYYGLQSLAYAVNSSNEVKAMAYSNYGGVLFRSEMYDSALICFEKAQTFIGPENYEMQLYNQQQLSNVYNWLGYTDKAIYYQFEAIRASEHSRIGRLVCETYLGACGFFENLGDIETSLMYCKKAENINKYLKNPKLTSRIYIKYGVIARHQVKDFLAVEYFKKALEAERLNGDSSGVASVYGSLGGTYVSIWNGTQDSIYLKMATTCLEQQLNMSIANNEPMQAMGAYNRLTGCWMDFGQEEKAKQYAHKALVYAKRFKAKFEESVSYYYLLHCFEKTKDWDSAFYYLRKYDFLKDSLSGDESKKTLLKTQYKYEYEKKALFKTAEFEKEQAIKDSIIAKNEVYTERLLLGGISIISIFVIVLLIIAYSNQQRKRKNQQKFSAQILQSQEEERIRISKDLHDGVGQNLLLLKNLDHDHAELVQSTIDDLRIVLKNLHPVQLEKIGFTATIKSMTETIEKSTGIFISGEFENIDNILPKEAEINLYRIIQECLNNIIKHSGAEDSRIDIIQKGDLIQVTVQDNGKGFDWKKALNNNSFGLTSIIERVHILRGNINIQSTHGNTKISIEIPR